MIKISRREKTTEINDIFYHFAILNWRRKWQPTPVFLPGESQGQRSLVGYSPWMAKTWTQLSN